MAECGPIPSLDCLGGAAASAVAKGGLQAIADMINEGAGKALAAMGAFWVAIPTPEITGTGTDTNLSAATAPGAGGFVALTGFITWVSLIVAALALLGVFASFSIQKRGGSEAKLGRLGAVLVAVLMVSAGAGVVSAILPTASSQRGSSAVAFLQQSTWWFAGGMALISILIGAARLAWSGQAKAAKDVAQSILTLIIVGGGGITIVATLTALADGFSIWILLQATDADFGSNIMRMTALTGGTGAGLLAIICLGFIAAISAWVQVALMVARGGIIVVLAGGLPTAASFTSMDSGRAFFQKYAGWLLGFILYKPAAAFIYAAAFRLTATPVEDATGLVQMLTGCMFMVLAVVALPAILRLVVPAAGAIGGGAGMAGAAAAGALGGAAADVATGAMKKGASGSGFGSSGASGSSGSQGGPGLNSQSGPSGAQSSGKPSGGNAGGVAAKGAGPTGAGSGATAGAGAGATAGGGAAASGAAAAAGPVGAAAVAGGKAIKAGADMAQNLASGAAESATGGESSGPSGSDKR